MTAVTISGWRPGLLKISLTKLTQEYSGQDLAAAKHAVDDVLEGKSVKIEFAYANRAADFAAKAERVGAKIST